MVIIRRISPALATAALLLWPLGLQAQEPDFDLKPNLQEFEGSRRRQRRNACAQALCRLPCARLRRRQGSPGGCPELPGDRRPSQPDARNAHHLASGSARAHARPAPRAHGDSRSRGLHHVVAQGALSRLRKPCLPLIGLSLDSTAAQARAFQPARTLSREHREGVEFRSYFRSLGAVGVSLDLPRQQGRKS